LAGFAGVWAKQKGTAVNEGQNYMTDAPEVMNIRQASQYLGVSADTLYKYVYEERIPAFKLGNRWKFKKTILDAWMERKSTQGEGRGRKKIKAHAAGAHL
jgi:excisionase family DNA binding protein